MAFVSKFTGPEIDRRLAQGTYDDAVAAGFTGTKEQFDAWIAAYTPEEMEKLNNKQDKEDPTLETENKTVVGAINLLNSEKQDKEDERLATESKIVVDAINELNTRTTDLYYDKQDKEDSGLATEQKTIVGAINELKLELQDQDSQKQDKVDDGFATNDKSVVGAVNEIHNELDTHVADYNKHVDEYEAFKADTENILNSHSTQIGQLTQEKQDKTDFNLATESKTIVSAINENYAAINAEITRAIAEDARLEEVKVPYTDISDSSNPDRKTIMLKNHDSISGYGTDGTAAYNLAMVSKWDKADFGSTGIPINLNGSEAHPTYNDKEELAFVSELTGEASRLDEDIRNLNETIATVNQNLSANIATLNQNVTDGFNTINGGINNEIRPAIEKNAKDIGVVNDTLTQKIEETEEKLQEDINYLKPRVATLETLQIKSVNPDSENYAASYELQDSTGKTYGVRINVAKDQFLKSVGYADNILTLTFILADGTEYPQQVDLTGLVDEYIAGAGISVTTTDDGKKVINIADDALQKIQYADSEVRRLEQDKISYAYDEKTQSNINVILPEGGSYLGNYGDENATIAKAAIYDGVKQLEIGSSKVHLNLNSSDKPTIETPDGKENLVVESDIELMPKEIRIPIRSIKDKIYTQEEILGWFGVEDIVSLKKIIAYGGIQYVKYGLSLSTNPHYYKMPVEYVAFESANQIKLVFVGLNTRDDVASKYEIIMNLDGTIIEGNSNVKMTVTSIEPGDIDLSKYVTKEELNDYALKSELPDVSNLATKDEIPSLDGYATIVELENKVDKIEGKQLSTEDYTTEEKEKLASLENYDDTSLRSELQQTETGVATANTEIEKLKSGKQDTLVSGENIKTINGTSILGNGDITISGAGGDYNLIEYGVTPYETLVEMAGNGKPCYLHLDEGNMFFFIPANMMINQDEIVMYPSIAYAGSSSSDSLQSFGIVSPYAFSVTNENVWPDLDSIMRGLEIRNNMDESYSATLTAPTSDAVKNYVTEQLEPYAKTSDVSSTYQPTLVSGTSIKTINGESLLGSGDIEITSGSSEVTWDNVTGKPSFATVATSGSYSDLTGTPDLSTYQIKNDETLTTTDKTVVGAINELMAKITELEQRIATLEGGGSNNYNLTELTDVSNGVCNRLNVTPDDFIRTDNNLQYIKLNVDDQDRVLIPYNDSTESVHANALMLIYGRSDPQFKFNKDDFSLSGKVYNSTTSSWDYKSYSFRTAYDEDAYTPVVFYDANLKDSRDDSITHLSDIYVVKSFEEKYDQMMQEIEDMNLPDPPQE